MLNIQQIEQQYPEPLRVFKRNILREYLQYKVLEIIFNSEQANKISFLGGTALRMIYDNSRFSEDLDFDNFGLTENEFGLLAQKIKTGLENQGLKVEISLVSKGAYRCNIRLPEILFANELSPYQEEKILIQIDSFAHNFVYQPEKRILNKFDVFSEIFITPTEIILSQKIFAALNRKRAKGRDFFDIVFLLSFVKPSYPYLKEKIGVGDAKELKKKFLEFSQELDFKALAKDVQPFLFQPNDSKKVEIFLEFIKQANL